MYDDQFLGALGAWQRGWSESPTRRAEAASELARTVADLPLHVRQVIGPCYRKRFLFKTDTVELFVGGGLDEGFTSWTLDRTFAEHFKGIVRSDAVTAALFQHTPPPSEVLLNIVALWDDPAFLTAVDDYVARMGQHADALANFKASQGEVILSSRLESSEVIGLTGTSSGFEVLCDQIGVIESARPAIYRDLLAKGIFPDEPAWIWDEVAQRTIAATRAAYLSIVAALKRMK